MVFLMRVAGMAMAGLFVGQTFGLQAACSSCSNRTGLGFLFEQVWITSPSSALTWVF